MTRFGAPEFREKLSSLSASDCKEQQSAAGVAKQAAAIQADLGRAAEEEITAPHAGDGAAEGPTPAPQGVRTGPPRGLTNTASWCYLNATLQALLHTPDFGRRLQEDHARYSPTCISACLRGCQTK